MHPTKAIRHSPNVVLRFAPRVSCPALPFFMGLFLGVFAPFGTAAAVVWPQNGHTYEAVIAPGISWDAAQAACVARGGYLATITSGQEDSLVKDLVAGNPSFWVHDCCNDLGPWLGGFQPPDSPEPAGGWQWVTGEPWSYTGWLEGNPDNCCGGQDRLTLIRFNSESPIGWDDTETLNPVGNRTGYIFEAPAAPADRPPTVSSPPGINGAEGGTLAFDVSASDPDEDAITSLTANLSALPEGNGATFTPHEGNTSGSFLWHTTSGDAGTYRVSFRATSNDLSGTDTTAISVAPAGAEVTGLLTWTPRPGDEGVYNVIFSATDAGGTSTLTTAITVVPGSPSPAPLPPLSTPSLRRPGASLSPDAPQRGPIVSGPPRAGVAPGTTLTVPVSASTAPAGTSPLAAALRPASAPKMVHAAQVISLSADLTNLPPINDATFVVDHAPVVGGPSSVTASAGVPVTFVRSASDVDGDPIGAFTADLSGLPAGNNASFSANAGNTVGTFSWTPKLTDAGAFVVSFTASNQLVGSASTTITVRTVSAARIFLPGQQKISLGSGHREVCVQIEPVGRSFELADVNLATVRMISFGTGTVSEIPAISGRGLEIGDRDRNRIPDMTVCFTMADLRRLFSLLGGNDNNGDFHQSMGRRRIRHPVTVTIQGQLTSGAFFAGTWTVDVKFDGESENDVRISPNPLNPQGELAFALVKSGFVRVTLFDMQGRLVRTLLEEANAIAGEHSVTFDGRDATGAKLASGIYFFHIESPDGSKRGRLAIVR